MPFSDVGAAYPTCFDAGGTNDEGPIGQVSLSGFSEGESQNQVCQFVSRVDDANSSTYREEGEVEQLHELVVCANGQWGKSVDVESVGVCPSKFGLENSSLFKEVDGVGQLSVVEIKKAHLDASPGELFDKDKDLVG